MSGCESHRRIGRALKTAAQLGLVSLVALLSTAATTLSAQRVTLVATSGRMLYDAGGDKWKPSTSIGVFLQANPRLRAGLLGSYTNVGVFDTSSYVQSGPEHFNRLSAVVDWDAAPIAFAYHSALFVRGGFGLARSQGHPQFKDPRDQIPLGRTTGLSLTTGAGLRVGLVSRVALQGGLDFHYDELLDAGLRDWTWSMGVAITP